MTNHLKKQELSFRLHFVLKVTAYFQDWLFCQVCWFGSLLFLKKLRPTISIIHSSRFFHCLLSNFGMNCMYVYKAGFLRCFSDLNWVPSYVNRDPRIKENYHRVPRIRENQVPRIREIGSLEVHTRCLTFSLKKTLIQSIIFFCFCFRIHNCRRCNVHGIYHGRNYQIPSCFVRKYSWNYSNDCSHSQTSWPFSSFRFILIDY